ncbi:MULTISPECIES: MFS transporter [Thiomicrorhabdus]|uniref:MFS transporter n=1 Tax=Thiomicrorhabdus heinhorstiae TaxID=2748010 RepID=A0ABS0BU18_9GAMM|nr:MULTISPECIES: MFS transporter [Thiomicrorhabdus]MBF6057330.1 MFS transporter [Thiomicrorhabdus heinhorstiae]
MHECSYQSAYTRLSIHYFFYFSVLGTTVPYLGLYLQSLSFSPIQIGQLLAVLMFTKVIAPNVWGWLADRSGRSIHWVRIATALTLVSALGFFLFEDYWGLFFTILIYSFFWHASLPQFESYTFRCLGDDRHLYGKIRLWGSIGFIAAVLLLGWQIEHLGIQTLPVSLFGMLFVVWASAYLVKDRRVQIEEGSLKGFKETLKRPEVIALLLVSFLVQLSHGVYYAFYTIQMDALGYEKTTIAWLWALGVLAEIGIFFWMARLFHHYPLRFLILISIALTVLRWILTGYFADSLFLMLLAQTLHAASFGLFHAAAIHLTDTYFTGSQHGRGQAIFAASSHGLGGALGMLTAGYTWALGGATLSYGLSVMIAAVALAIAWRWIK